MQTSFDSTVPLPVQKKSRTRRSRTRSPQKQPSPPTSPAPALEAYAGSAYQNSPSPNNLPMPVFDENWDDDDAPLAASPTLQAGFLSSSLLIQAQAAASASAPSISPAPIQTLPPTVSVVAPVHPYAPQPTIHAYSQPQMFIHAPTPVQPKPLPLLAYPQQQPLHHQQHLSMTHSNSMPEFAHFHPHHQHPYPSTPFFPSSGYLPYQQPAPAFNPEATTALRQLLKISTG